MTSFDWFDAHLADYREALARGDAEYLAQQLLDLRSLAAHLIGETA